MSETLPPAEAQTDVQVHINPIVMYTGVLSNPLLITTYRSAVLVKTPGLVYDDPDSVAINTLDYKDTTPVGGLLSLVANMTHIIWSSSISSTSLTSASFPNLVVGVFTWNTPALSSLSLPNLEFTPISYGINISSGALVNLSLPKLNYCDDIITIICPVFETLDLPELVFTGSINITSNALRSVNASKLIQPHDGINIIGGSNFTSITFGTLAEINGDVTINGALPMNIVDGILIALSNMAVTYQNHTVTLKGSNAPPSPIGLVAISTLQSNNNTVVTN